MYPGQPNQQPPTTLQDPLRIPRRELDPEDLVDVLRRNKSWIAAPVLLGLVVAVVVAFLWQDTYQSTAMIRIVPAQVPERLVPSVVNLDMNESVQSMAQTILSRGTLTSIIEQLGLYPQEQEELPMEDIISQMNKDISIGGVRAFNTGGRSNQDLTAFEVSFRYHNRYLAQKVTGEIVSRFISENMREKANRAAMTTQFIQDAWQMAKNELDAIEQKRTDFQVRYAGQLPDQWPVRMQQMSASDSRISTLNSNISQLNQQKLILEGQMRGLQDRVSSLMQTGVRNDPQYVDPTLANFNKQLTDLEQRLMAALQVYTDKNPDILRMKDSIALLKSQRDAYTQQIASAQSNPDDPGAAAQPPQLTEAAVKEIRDTNTRINDLELQKQSIDMQIEQATREIAAQNERLQTLTAQLHNAPVSEQQWVELNRDYDLAKQNYDDLNRKMVQSQMATDLENRKQGETLELLDPANLPETPTDPQRSMIIGGGAAAGLGLGLALVFLREIRDTTLKTLKDVRAYTQLTVLGSVPLLENDLVVMRRKRMAWLGWTAATIVSVVVMASAVWYYYNTQT